MGLGRKENVAGGLVLPASAAASMRLHNLFECNPVAASNGLEDVECILLRHVAAVDGF